MKTLLIASLLFFTSLLSAASLNSMVVFGDSLSDNGNLYEFMKHQLPVSPPYFEGRFSNGPVWVELLIRSYYHSDAKAHLFNYAFGGAGVLEDEDSDDGLFTLKREMDSYFLAHQEKADENSMYVIWIGSNNYLGVPPDMDKAVRDVNLGIQHGLQRLVDNGAKHILVVNVPNLGIAPVAREFGAVEELTYLSKQHNILLEQQVKDLQNQYSDIQWIYLDVNKTLEDMVQHPEFYGLTNVTDTCYEQAAKTRSSRSILKMVSSIKPNSNTSGDDVCEGYLFFDPVHPASAVHILMAEKAREVFDDLGIEFN